MQIFEAILYQPLFNLFVGLYNVVPDVGAVIVIITLAIKFLLYPLTSKSIKAQKALTDLQPKLEALKEQYKDDQQKLAQETMKVWQENKVNPLGSCLPILVQLPIFLAFYWVLRDGLGTTDFSLLYSFVPAPEVVNALSLGRIDLSVASPLLAIAAGLAQFWQAKMFSRKRAPQAAGKGGKDENMMAMMNKQMLYFMPALTVIIGFQLPGGLALYWFLSTLTTALQQQVLFKEQDAASEGPKDAIDGKVID